MHDLGELIAWNDAHKDRELTLFGQDLFAKAQAKGPLTSGAYKKLKSELKAEVSAGVDKPLDKDHLDALVAVTIGPPWLIDHVNGDGSPGGSTSLAAVSGYPSVTVPIGLVRGLPIGLSFIGRAFSEEKLLALAYALEQARGSRPVPRYLPTVADP